MASSTFSPIVKGDIVASLANGQVNEYSPSGTLVQTLISNATTPTGSAFDEAGNLYVTEFGGNDILKVDASTGAISVFSNDSILGDGTSFNAPESIAFGPGYTRMYVSDANRDGANGGIHIIDTATGKGVGFLPLPSSSGSEGTGESDWLAFDHAGTLFMTNENPSQGIMQVDPTSGDIVQPSLVANLPTYGYALSFDANGNMWLSDTSSILEYDPSGKLINTITNPSFQTVFSAVFNPPYNTVYAGDLSSGNIFTYDLHGNLLNTFNVGSGVDGLSVAGTVVAPGPHRGLSVTPTAGPPGTTFHLTYSCPAGELPTVAVTDPDGHIVDVYDVQSTPPVTGNGTDYTQTIQVGPDGSYLAALSCGGTPAESAAFSVVAAGYAGLGDSYSSGEGASVFDPVTASGTNRCHRSATGYAWERMVAATYGHGFDFAACSGALIDDFYQYNSRNDGEVPQIDHVSRHQATSLVTLTIGGNNVGFPSVLADCVTGLFSNGKPGCAQRDQRPLSQALSWLTNGRPAGCYPLPGKDLATGQPAQICSPTPVPSLHQLYEDIARRLAPNGELIVAGYPRLLGSQFTKVYPLATAPRVFYIGCEVGSRGPLQYGLSAGDVGWLNQKGIDLNDTISGEVARAAADIKAVRPDVTIKFVPVDAQFDHHRICDTGTPWIHALEFSGLDKPSQESFHPTDDGQKAYGEVIRTKI